MSANVMVRAFGEKAVQFKEIDGSIYANANSMTDSITIKNWKRNSMVKRYLEAIALRGTSVEMVISSKGGVDNGGTWIHEKLVMSLARHINVDFEIWCDEQIADIIKGDKQPVQPMTRLEMLNQLVEYEEKTLELTAQIETDKPKVEFAMAVKESVGTMSVGKVAKQLGYGRNTFFQILRDDKVLNTDNTPAQRFIATNYFEVRAIYVEKINLTTTKTYVTPKGLIWLEKKYRK